MSKLKTTYQGPGNITTGDTPPGTHGEQDGHEKADARAGTGRDTDTTGESKNQGHRHPRNQHGE